MSLQSPLTASLGWAVLFMSASDLFRAALDQVVVTLGGWPRLTARHRARSIAARGESGIVAVCHFPNTGASFVAHDDWKEFALTVNGRQTFVLRKISRRVVYSALVEPGSIEVRAWATNPPLGVRLEINEAQAALVVLEAGDHSAPRSGSMTVTLFDRSGLELETFRGAYVA